MSNITMIAAIGKNRELGKNNDLIWRFKEDMKFFQENTMGKPMLMGIKTLESLTKLLSGRKHIVITSKKRVLPEEVRLVHSVDEALEVCREYDEVMVIGGASIYAQMLDYSNKLILTEINATSDADVFFPEFDQKDWNRKFIGEHQEDNIVFKHTVYTRKNRILF